jgi:hypothetical protein
MKTNRKFIVGRKEEWMETRWRDACDRASVLLGDPFEARVIAEEMFDDLGELDLDESDGDDADDDLLDCLFYDGIVTRCLCATGCPASAECEYMYDRDDDEEDDEEEQERQADEEVETDDQIAEPNAEPAREDQGAPRCDDEDWAA